MRFGIGQPEIDAVADCIRKGELARFQVGKNGRIARCEKELAALSGTNYALLVNSGTSALICGMVALGIGPGDDVLVSSYTWISSPLAPMLVGAIPRLVEMDDTLTMDPDDLEAKIRPDTKAIICVHMMNMPCDMEKGMLAKYDESAAPRTLDLMRRTCDVTPRWDMTDEEVAARVDSFYA